MKVRGGPTVFEKKARVHIGGGGGLGGCHSHCDRSPRVFVSCPWGMPAGWEVF